MFRSDLQYWFVSMRQRWRGACVACDDASEHDGHPVHVDGGNEGHENGENYPNSECRLRRDSAARAAFEMLFIRWWRSRVYV